MDELKARISEALENELAKIYEEKGITSGDITPEQLLEWERIAEDAAKLFGQLIDQNEKNGVILPF
jgi:hypothetical protein